MNWKIMYIWLIKWVLIGFWGYYGMQKSFLLTYTFYHMDSKSPPDKPYNSESPFIFSGKPTATAEFQKQNCGKPSASAEHPNQNCGRLSATAEHINQNCGRLSATAEHPNQNCGKLSTTAEHLNQYCGWHSAHFNSIFAFLKPLIIIKSSNYH